MRLFYLYLSLAVVFFTPLQLWCQFTNEQIDSMIGFSREELRKEGDFEQALPHYKQTLQAAKINLYQAGIVASYMHLGNVYLLRSDYKNSIRYLDSSLQELEGLHNPQLTARVFAELGRSYSGLNMYQRANGYYEKALEASQKIAAERPRRAYAQYIYNLQSVDLGEQNQYDSSFALVKKAFESLPGPMIASKIARHYLESDEKNIDSARRYLDLAQTMWRTGKYPVQQRSMILRNEGLYHFTIKDFDKAVAYYKESIQISKKMKNVLDEKRTQKMLYDVYKATNDEKGKALALEQYTAISDSITREKEKATEARVEQWLEENNTHHERKMYGLYGAIALVGVMAAGLYWRQRKSRAKLYLKDQILEEKANENQELLKKVNDSYQDLIALAKENDPAFYFRFQEVYPELEPKLLSLSPGLRNSELLLCAYIFLGFNAKEIAVYTFKSVKTVQNRKYNLRKKFELPSDDDMGIWFRNLLDL